MRYSREPSRNLKFYLVPNNDAAQLPESLREIGMRYRIRFDSPLHDEELPPELEAREKQSVQRYKIMIVPCLVLIGLCLWNRSVGLFEAVMMCAVGVALIVHVWFERRAISMSINEDPTSRHFWTGSLLITVLIGFVLGVLVMVSLGMRSSSL